MEQQIETGSETKLLWEQKRGSSRSNDVWLIGVTCWQGCRDRLLTYVLWKSTAQSGLQSLSVKMLWCLVNVFFCRMIHFLSHFEQYSVKQHDMPSDSVMLNSLQNLPDLVCNNCLHSLSFGWHVLNSINVSFIRAFLESVKRCRKTTL